MWSNMSQLANALVSTDCDGAQICFKSEDGSFYLRQEAGRWILDQVDERGQRHDDAASFSSFELAEKYLIWNWASVARSAIGAPGLGRALHALGFNPEVRVDQLREGIYRLTSPFGDAVVMGVPATIFSHLMSKSVDDIEQMVRQDLK
ncbi:hypothetical protein [Mycobacterium sp. IDR2000157661]|uniref:hypothetical protein n=1 Tax=Mycobacterium sp. IDR2000157661 TaxID=2867005 RepID=UPI001EEAB861|nr:hypothetical protein [Mycobacterium sp. IDR2000157661]ULE34025.1 hypothetical protein K3G64_04905 [Mycobacterium sp. IDR2000157661]